MLTREAIINLWHCAEARAEEAEAVGQYHQANREWDTALSFVYRSATIRKKS